MFIWKFFSGFVLCSFFHWFLFFLMKQLLIESAVCYGFRCWGASRIVENGKCIRGTIRFSSIWRCRSIKDADWLWELWACLIFWCQIHFTFWSLALFCRLILDFSLLIFLAPIRCSHYRRRCKIRAPCCNEIFDCRHCHNDVKVYVYKKLWSFFFTPFSSCSLTDNSCS